jgi:hypothetical protein
VMSLPRMKRILSPPRYIEAEETSSEVQKRPAFSHDQAGGYRFRGFDKSLLYRIGDTGLAGPAEVYSSRRMSLAGRSGGRRDTMEGLPMVKLYGQDKAHGILDDTFIGTACTPREATVIQRTYRRRYRPNRTQNIQGRKPSKPSKDLVAELLGPPPTRDYKMANERATELCAKSEKFHFCWTGDAVRMPF